MTCTATSTPASSLPAPRPAIDLLTPAGIETATFAFG